MIGTGTIINCAAIVAGGVVGHFTGKLFRQEQQDALNKACGVSVLFIAIAGAMQGMLAIDGAALVSGKAMLVVLCLAIGTVFGELIGIEKGFERFGEWLKQKTGNASLPIPLPIESSVLPAAKVFMTRRPEASFATSRKL